MTTTSTSLSSIFPTFLKPNPNTNNLHFLHTTHKILFPASTTLSCKSLLLNLPTKLHSKSTPKSTQSWRIHAEGGDAISKTVQTSQEIVAASDDGVAKIISALLFAAFVGLSVLTIGVIYIAVTDFLQKREKEKFEKEEAAKKKKKKNKSGKRKVMRARSGPRGFGQKIEEEEEDDD